MIENTQFVCALALDHQLTQKQPLYTMMNWQQWKLSGANIVNIECRLHVSIRHDMLGHRDGNVQCRPRQHRLRAYNHTHCLFGILTQCTCWTDTTDSIYWTWLILSTLTTDSCYFHRYIRTFPADDVVQFAGRIPVENIPAEISYRKRYRQFSKISTSYLVITENG